MTCENFKYCYYLFHRERGGVTDERYMLGERGGGGRAETESESQKPVKKYTVQAITYSKRLWFQARK